MASSRQISVWVTLVRPGDPPTPAKSIPALLVGTDSEEVRLALRAWDGSKPFGDLEPSEQLLTPETVIAWDGQRYPLWRLDLVFWSWGRRKSCTSKSRTIFETWQRECAAFRDEAGVSGSSEGPSNEFLRFKGNYTFDNGDPYREWILLVDVPEIPLRVEFNRPVAGKTHLQRGDVMREVHGESLTFKRRGIHVAAPERWQLAEVLAGLFDREPQAPALDPGALLLRRLVPRGPMRAWFWGNQIGSGEMFDAFRVLDPIPAAGLEPDDLLVHMRYGSGGRFTRFRREELRGIVQRVPRSALRILIGRGESFDPVDGSYGIPTIESLIRRLKGASGPRNAQEHTANFLLLRQHQGTELASEQIIASSDEIASVELIYQVGGRMPRGED